eukprot:3472537-Prymnesium_polylepis.1
MTATLGQELPARAHPSSATTNRPGQKSLRQRPSSSRVVAPAFGSEKVTMICTPTTTTYSLLRPVYHLVLAACSLLPTAYCLLLATYCLLPHTSCYHLLPTYAYMVTILNVAFVLLPAFVGPCLPRSSRVDRRHTPSGAARTAHSPAAAPEANPRVAVSQSGLQGATEALVQQLGLRKPAGRACERGWE